VVTIAFSILLAIAADAAWGYRSDRAEEARLLEALHAEFTDAGAEVQNDLDSRQLMLGRLSFAEEARTGRTPPPDSLPAIVGALLDWRFYTPAHAVLDDAISSGRLDLIRSDEVRRAIMSYDQERGRLEVFDARERDLVSAQIEPYLARVLPLDRLLSEGGGSGDEDDRLAALLASDDVLASLGALKRQRTEEASTFSRVLQRRILSVLEALEASR